MAQRPYSAPHLPIAAKYQPPSPRQALPAGGNGPYQPQSQNQAVQLGGHNPLRLLVAGKSENAMPQKQSPPQPTTSQQPQYIKAAGGFPNPGLRRISSIAEEFVVEALLGKGSYGSAYRARRIRDGMLCAVKRVCMEGMSADDLRETLNEVQVLQSLHHPFVIEMQSCFLTSKHLNIVMPLADCGDLSSFIKNQRGCILAEGDVLIMFTQICCALKHVHDRKILHRDIKSANILLCTGCKGNLEAKLADFGIARVLHGTMELASTAVGTPYYMSPELCKNESYDSKSDVWALGCLLYEMCTQKNPFTGVNFSGLALKILRGKYPPLPNSYSKNMSMLVSMMLEVEAYKRPTVSQILKLPFIASLLPRVLDKETLRREFSHTILHGFCADDVNAAMKEVACDPKYGAQIQPLRPNTAQDSVAICNEKEREKSISSIQSIQPRERQQYLHMEEGKPSQKPAPSIQVKNSDPIDAYNAVRPILRPDSAIDAAPALQRLPDGKRLQPTQPCPQISLQPDLLHQIGKEATDFTEDIRAQQAQRYPFPANQMQKNPDLPKPNEPEPSSEAFVIVHVETPMQLSKKGAPDPASARKIALPHEEKKPSMDKTVQADFTLLGSTLQLDEKPSTFEASASLRVEMLRAYLEKNLGVEVFCKIYELLVSVETHITDEDLERDLLKALKDPSKSCFLNVVCQLIVCEDRLNAHYNKESLTPHD